MHQDATLCDADEADAQAIASSVSAWRGDWAGALARPE
jgi:hypothetical protein